MNSMWSEIHEQPEVIRACLAANHERLDEIASNVKERNIKYIVIAARGSSDHAGVYGKYMIETLAGYPVSLAAPSVFTIYGATVRFADALVVGVSQSGEAEDILSVLRAAQNYGAPTVGITNQKGSPIARLAEYSLDCSAGKEESVAATKTFTAQMFLLGLLAIKLSEDPDRARAFERIPEEMSGVLHLADEIKNKAVRYCFAEDMIILARGLDYCVALESALKIEETTYIRAKAFAASDFYHGPIAIVDSSLPILVYATAGPELDDMRRMIRKLMEIGANVLVISDDAETCGLGTDFIRLPAAASFLTAPFMSAAIGQLFAYFLSKAKQLDPDNPRLLHKITITR